MCGIIAVVRRPADRTPPDPVNWNVAPPAAGGRGPLAVTFPEPLDHALLQHMVRVVDADTPGVLMPAVSVHLPHHETDVSFLLFGAAPTDDDGLVGLADRLDDLESRIAPSRPSPSSPSPRSYAATDPSTAAPPDERDLTP